MVVLPAKREAYGCSDLLAELKAYRGANQTEEVHRDRMIALAENEADCFIRSCFEPGHITGSALLVSNDGGSTLLNHHKSLDKWLCFGGHADGEPDILNVAMRETVEEAGVENFEDVIGGIFDIDIHPIPENPSKGEPGHEHFDIRYLLRAAEGAVFKLSDESNELRWCSYQEARVLVPGDGGMRRMLDKWQEWLASS